jgi:predicted transcriptional regulator of viral defense system
MRYSERMPTDRFAELAELAADQYGLFTLQDAHGVGYAPNSVAQMARRGRLERVSQGVYRIAFLPAGALGSYMEAALWPVGVKGLLSHATALDLWDVSDINPSKVHITVPRAHRPQRQVPRGYVIHREDLPEHDIAAIEGIPVVTLARAVEQCAAAHIGLDLLEQAVRTGRAHGLLSPEQAEALTRELGLDRVAPTRA